MIELIAILDRSGSMSGKEADVIGGFNQFLDEQKKLPGKAKLTLVLFDDERTVVYSRAKLNDVQPITNKEYQVRGSTALLDAVGTTLSEAKNTNKGLVFIFTDGQENQSREYTKDQIKNLIKSFEEKGCEIHFVGAGIDSFAEAGAIGINAKFTMNTTNDSKGVRSASLYATTVASSYRSRN